MTSAHAIKAGVEIGQVLAGKYRVDAILGHGAMGVVTRCTHLQLNDRVAIKVLRTDVLDDEDAVQRFLREAQAAVRLKSEYVARVSDVSFENGVPYMVMEYLDGQDLGNLLDERGQLPVAWATELVLQAADALAEAHALGIVHRDIKPTNLFVTWRSDGSALIKVLDFGISKSTGGADLNITQTQSVLGTPAYMSPEQMKSARAVDHRTDIWSLGSVLYEAIEGHLAFMAESFSEMCVRVTLDDPLPMKNAPPALQRVILRCLEKSPEKRYATMGELGRELLPFTQDSRGAQIMVDRMLRLGQRTVPDQVGGPRSSPVVVAAAPVPAPVLAMGTDPAQPPASAVMMTAPAPASQAFAPAAAAASIVPPQTDQIRAMERSTAMVDVTAPRSRRSKAFIVSVVAAVVVGAVGAFAIASSMSESATTAVSPAASASDAMPAKTAGVAAPVVVTPPAPTVVPPTRTPTPPPTPIAGSADGSAATVTPPPPPPPPPPTADATPSTSTRGKQPHATRKTPTASNAGSATPPTPTNPAQGSATPTNNSGSAAKSNCNPSDSYDGCPP